MKKLQEIGAELLKDKTVSGIWGYAVGTHPLVASPLYVDSLEAVEQLTFNPFCYHSLPNYLRDFRGQKTAVVLKRCDLAAVNLLLQEGQLIREDLYLLLLDGEKLIDHEKLALHLDLDKVDTWAIDKGHFVAGETRVPLEKVVFDKCGDCAYENLDNFDKLISLEHKVECPPPAVDFLVEYQKLSAKERWEEWEDHFGKCIQCFACRQVCPMCYCNECIADKEMPRFIPKSVGGKQNTVWQITRVMHLVGRCIDCGECERVCPAKIPLRRLTYKMRTIAKENYKYLPGGKDDQVMFWSSYDKKDPEDLIFHPEGK